MSAPDDDAAPRAPTPDPGRAPERLPDPVRIGPAAHPPATDPGARLGRWMLVGMWVLLLGLGTGFAQRALDARSAPVTSAAPDGAAQLELRADRLGHYSVTALVDGEPVEFLVDTGASGISVPAGVADRLGLARGREIATRTANGTGRAWATRIARLRVGPFERTDVAAYVTPGLEGEIGLLGTSFLRQFELVQRDGRLILREAGAR